MPRKRPAAPGETGFTKLADGRWRARRVIKGKAVFREAATRDLAKKRMDEAIKLAEEYGAVVPVSKTTATVPEFVDLWLESIRPVDNPKSSPTYVAYEFHAKRLASALPWKLREVTAADLLALYKTFADRPRSAQYLHKTARKMFAAAVAWGYLERNAAATVPTPKYSAGEVCPPAPEELVKVLAANEVYAGRRYVRKDTLTTFLILMLHSGCRPSELLGLTWDDAGWDRCSITITKTRDGRTGDEKAVKTRKSRREVSLSSTAMEALAEHKARQVKTTGGLVFANDRNGGPLKVGNLRMDFKRLCAVVGLPGEYTLYDLRHTHATQMLAAGMPLHELSWRLGHASVSITADVYSHKVQKKDAEWAEKLAGVLAG